MQVTGRLNPNPTPPSIDVYPGDPFRDTPTAGFGQVGGELLFTVRARVTTVDNIAGQNLLLRLMDDEDDISVAGTLMEDQTLNGHASQRLRGRQHRLHPLPRRWRRERRPARLRMAGARPPGDVVSLWFVVPAHGRYELTRICLEQLRRTCDALPYDATAVVVAEDQNLYTAADLGFATVHRDNDFLARKFNDGIQLACDPNYNPEPADYVVPFG